MKPRFSLRWLLIAFTLLTIVFYAFFIRPTMLANRFALAIRTGDQDTLELLCRNAAPRGHWFFEKDASIEIQPQTWADVWRCRRRIQVATHSLRVNNTSGFTSRYAGMFEAGVWKVKLPDSYFGPFTFYDKPSGVPTVPHGVDW